MPDGKKRVALIRCDDFEGCMPAGLTQESMFETLFNAARPGVESNSFWWDREGTLHEDRVLMPAVEWEYHDAHKRKLPREIDPDMLYLIAGSRAGVYEDRSWIAELLQWIRNAFAGKAKLAGVCFGHQALVQALGGVVIHHPNGWGLGLRTSDVTSSFLAEALGKKKLRLFYNHGDQAIELPAGAENLASSGFCKYEAMRIGSQVISFQGHPEYTESYLRWFLAHKTEDSLESFRENAAASLASPQHDGVEAARLMLSLISRGI